MRLAVGLLLFGLLAATGCASRRNADLLEARLRDQEDQLRALHTQVDQAKSELTAARRLNDSLKQKLVQPASHETALNLSEQQFQAVGLKINSLLTGGFDRDGKPGDDQVTLVFSPIDRREQPVQVPGHVDCELLDLTNAAQPKRIGLWSFNTAKTAASWQKSLGSFGYRFELPWQTAPTMTDLELRVRFYSEHGDQFEASAPIRITLPSPALGAGQPMP